MNSHARYLSENIGTRLGRMTAHSAEAQPTGIGYSENVIHPWLQGLARVTVAPFSPRQYHPWKLLDPDLRDGI
jgi:hypothetical protein